MIRLTLKELAARKRRLLGSFFAVFLGVAFLSGTLVLGDTLEKGISGLIGRAYEGTDVDVRSAADVGEGPAARRGPIDAAALEKVRAVPGVAAAVPVVQGTGQPTRTDGQGIDIQGPRTAGNWIDDPALNPWRVAEGRPPAASGEVMIDRKVAKDGGLKVGDATFVLVPDRVPVRIVGIMTFGDADTLGGTAFTAFTLADAQRHLLPDPAKISSVAVKAADGVGAAELADRIGAVLPPGTQAITGDDLAAENIDAVGVFITYVRSFLTIFAVVALLVAAFSIHNTFAIIVAQRSREAALLRAVGASRRQILAGILVEAALLGLAGALAGAAAGYGLAALLKELFASMGFGPPTLELSYDPAPLLIAIPVGVLVTVLSCLAPAVRAGRVAPIEALRAADTEPRGRLRAPAGIVLTVLAAALTLWGVTAANSAAAGGGAFLALVAMVVLGPLAAGPFAALTGRGLPGVPGRLAAGNAVRSPRRTAGAATSLMIGVGVVTLFTIFASSLSATVEKDADAAFGGDIVVDAGGFGLAGFSTRLATDLTALPQIEAASGLGNAQARIDGEVQDIGVADPAGLTRVLRVDPLSDGLSVSTDTGLKQGDQVSVAYPDGASETLAVASVYRPVGGFTDYVMPRARWRAHVPQVLDSRVYVLLRDGTDLAAGKAAVERAAAVYGAPDVQTRKEFVDAQTAPVQDLLMIVYVMLALAIVIALMGIANTLALAVHERTREIGLLRAVGATRGQVRAMIRWESVLVALFGTAGGVALGTLLGWSLVEARDSVFALPVTTVAIVLVVGSAAGVLAAIRPARRAAKLPMITALSAV